MSSSVHSPGDHVEESLPLPRELLIEKLCEPLSGFSLNFHMARRNLVRFP